MKTHFLILLFILGISAIVKGSDTLVTNSEQTGQSSSQLLETNSADTNLEDSNNQTAVSDQATSKCGRDSDCTASEICDRTSQECVAKGIFPLSLSELIGSVLIMTVVGVGQAAGVGGGLVVVPLLMQFFQYESKKSIALVFVTIFSASLGNLSAYMRQKDKDGTPIIDYNIVIVSLPTIMIGSVYGVAFNKLLPQSAIAFMLLFFILKTVTKTYKSYQNQKKKEVSSQKLPVISSDTPLQDIQIVSAKQEKNKQSQLKESPFPQPPQTAETEQKSPQSEFLAPLPSSDLNIPLLDANLTAPKYQQYPTEILKKIAAITIGFIVFSLLRGGKKFPSIIQIPACGIVYQLCNLVALGTCFWIVNIIINAIVNSNKPSSESLILLEQKKQLSSPEMHKFANSAFKAGLIGSIVGIGGGMILVPQWLEFGVSASKTPACSITLLFLTAFNSLVQFSLAGAFQWEEFIYFSVLAFLSSFLISSSISDYVKRTNQNSLLILILVCFMVIALVMFLSLTIQQAMTDMSALFVFGEFC